MKSLLLIQFRLGEDIKEEQNSFNRLAKTHNFSYTPIRAKDSDIAWNSPSSLLDGYDGVIFGGSADFYFSGNKDGKTTAMFENAITNIEKLVMHIFTNDIPALGICFGHQVMGYFSGVCIEHDLAQAKVGAYEVELTEEGKKDKIFSKLREKFSAHYGHRDILKSLPDGAILLADGKKCSLSAVRYGNNVYGVQFHPELNAEDATKKVLTNIAYHNEDTMEYVKNIKDTPEAEALIKYFIDTL